MQQLQWLFIGLLCGWGLMVPVAMWAARRAGKRAREFELRARAAERLAELGTLTGGLAHEIKNPLSTITLNLQLLNESIADAELTEPHAGRLHRRIEALSAETQRLRAILEDFLRFAGRIKLDSQPQPINQVIEQLIDFYSPQAESSEINVTSQLDPNAGQIPLDEKMFKQAILNLLINATQAMVESKYKDKPHGGACDLFIRTESESDQVHVHIIDTGCGIDDETLKKIFQPYYSTRKGGTGLGLAITRRIIETHGGIITVHSQPGKGTDFQITRPRTPPKN